MRHSHGRTADPAGVFAKADPRFLDTHPALAAQLRRVATAALFAVGVAGLLLKAGAL